MRLYSDLASWFHLITHPSEYAIEADHLLRLIPAARTENAETLLELGSGGGNLASHLTHPFACTLTDLSADMLAISRELNPGAQHMEGDMRALRLGRPFDIVLAHDAIGYMTSEADLKSAIDTAAAHLRPGGLALFLPDAVTEIFQPGSDQGGVDEGGRGARYLEWTHEANADGVTYDVDYAFILREADGRTRVEHDRHRLGLFPRHRWLALMEEAGLTPLSVEVPDPYAGEREVFVARRRA
jgi:SAM-dependent methyltransferase